jgi:hypothetical protein
MSDADWRLYVEGNALVADFPADMPTDESVFAAVNEEFEKLATDPAVDTHISVVGMDSPLNSGVFEKAQEAARAGTEHGITTWIAVSEDIKKTAMKGEIGSIDGVDVHTASDLDEALALASE